MRYQHDMYMRRYFMVSLITFFVCSAINIMGQSRQIQFNLFSGIEGSTIGKINCITQDANGYMWFSDQTQKSITRFDGYHLKSYRNDPKNKNSLGGTYPEVVFADPSGVIWIGFYGTGLDKFDPKTGIFTHYRHQKDDPSSLSSDTVAAILRDSKGNLWVGNYGGLDLLDEKTGTFKHYRHDRDDPKSLSNNQIRSIYEDRLGTVWIGTGIFYDLDRPNQGGLNRFNRKGGNFTRYLHDSNNPKSLISNKVRAIFEDSRGTFWVGTSGDGLHTMNRITGEFERHTYNPSKPDQLSRPPLYGIADHITFIREDSLSNIWIGTMLSGINRYNPSTKKITHFGDGQNPDGDFTDNSGWWAYTSRDGVLWISTQQNNLYRVNPSYVKIPHIKIGNAALSFAEEPSGALWIGTDNGLIKTNENRIIVKHFLPRFLDTLTLSHAIVSKLFHDHKGRLWLGTENGLNLYNPVSQTFTRYLQPGENNRQSVFSGPISSILESQDGSFWIGGVGELTLMNRQSRQFTSYRRFPKDSTGLINDFIICLSEDKSGNLWLGRMNGGGLNRINPKTGNAGHYLASKSITSMHYDSDATLWVGTDLGIFRKTTNASDFSLFKDANSEIGSAYITSIVEDDYKNIWAGSLSGIFRIDPKRDRSVVYGKSNGIVPGFLSAFKTRKGELLFGNALGYYALFPDKLISDPKSLHIILTEFRIADIPILPGSGSEMDLPIEQTENIRLKFNQNNFSFEFAAIDYRNPDENQHRYMLEGYDNVWHKAGSENLAYYFNVPPGNYVFKVKASGNDGVWAEKSVHLAISPPWWKTWWAYLLYFALFAMVLYYVDRFQRRRLLKAEREKARGRELQQAKEIEKAYHQLKSTQAQLIQSEKMASLGELTAGIAHEIQNPLNFVNNFSEVSNELLEEMKSELINGNQKEAIGILENIQDNLLKINHHGSRADGIVKSMLQHSRNNTGKREASDINALAEDYLRLTYHGFRAKDKHFNVTIITDFDKSIGTVKINPQEIGRVLLNLLNNAFYAVMRKKDMHYTGDLSDDQTFEPTVTVKTRLTSVQHNGNSRKLEIIVEDNGMGIPENMTDKIFQPFFTTKPSGEGTGLGLSLSYDIVKSHGGDLSVKSNIEGGATFIITLVI